ncbi:cell division cycle 48C [Tanacetum coccineum]
MPFNQEFPLYRNSSPAIDRPPYPYAAQNIIDADNFKACDSLCIILDSFLLRRLTTFFQVFHKLHINKNARIKILAILTRNLNLEGAIDLEKISRLTPGFVRADLVALVHKAGNLAMNRIINGRKAEVSLEIADTEENENWWKKLLWSPEEMEKLSIIIEGFLSIPNVKWEDVGGLDSLRRDFERSIVDRIKYPDEYEPPGFRKTLIAKAVAYEAGANFLHIKGPDLLNEYVSKSERAVQTIFSRARTCSPLLTIRSGGRGG